MVAQRKSNIELLRILSIFFITMHHLVIRGAESCGYTMPYSFDQGIWGIIINSFCIVGVNCFILISGWFGIKNPIKSAIHLLFVFGILSTLMNAGLYLYQEEWEGIDLKAMYKFKYLWFLYDYILLAIISPLLERCINRMPFQVYTIVVIVATIINVVVCYGFQILNPYGYGLINFIYLYFVARYMRVLFEKGYLSKMKPGVFASIYAASCLLMAVLYFMLVYCGVSESLGGSRYFSYNNPLVLISSISLFCAMAASKPFYSPIVNTIATGVFSVYIMQASLQLCGYRNEIAHWVYENYSYFGLFVLGFAILIGCSIIGILVEQIWKVVEKFCKPVLDVWYDIK